MKVFLFSVVAAAFCAGQLQAHFGLLGHRAGFGWQAQPVATRPYYFEPAVVYPVVPACTVLVAPPAVSVLPAAPLPVQPSVSVPTPALAPRPPVSAPEQRPPQRRIPDMAAPESAPPSPGGPVIPPT